MMDFFFSAVRGSNKLYAVPLSLLWCALELACLQRVWEWLNFRGLRHPALCSIKAEVVMDVGREKRGSSETQRKPAHISHHFLISHHCFFQVHGEKETSSLFRSWKILFSWHACLFTHAFQNSKVHILDTETFETTFGPKAQRKNPELKAGRAGWSFGSELCCREGPWLSDWWQWSQVRKFCMMWLTDPCFS